MANNHAESEADAPPPHAANTSAARRTPHDTAQRTPSAAATSTTASSQTVPKPALAPATTASAGASPRTSRNTSPERRDSRPPPLANPPSTQPSAAAIQRALSAANVPQLQSGSASEATSKLPKPPKSAGASGDVTPRWPTSPRLKSPPPSVSNSRRGSNATQKKGESAAAPSISVQSATPQTPTPPPPAKQGGDETGAKVQQQQQPAQLQTPVKGPSRGPSGKSMLETVQENSVDDIKEPSPAAVKAAADLKPLTRLTDEEAKAGKAGSVNGDGETQSVQGESGSESAGAKTDKKKEKDTASIASRPKNGTAKSYASLASTKSRQADGKPNMTVETETVQSIPQSVLTTGDRSGGARNEAGGSVRTKPSNETIRPKKERKKATQKTRSLNQGTGTYSRYRSALLTSQAGYTTDDNGHSSASSSTVRGGSFGSSSPSPARRIPNITSLSHPFRQRIRSYRIFRTLSDMYPRKASSKADIFEARVANAVDEANSSDSEETFVYESNPPEPQQRRARHHSRTPSVTSSHSVADGQRGVRSFGDALDDRRVAGKRSMKFSNNAYNDIDGSEAGDGSVRSHTPRHFGRFGRGGSQASMFDPDSPFTQASKLRAQQLGARNSRPNSPRSPQGAHPGRTSGLFGTRKHEPSYDFDAEIGDDERTPLITSGGTIRTPRTRLHRRISARSVDGIDEYYGVRRYGRCGRFSGCLFGFVILVAVIMSAVVFLVMSNQPMYGVEICEIRNVLASEQELVFDLLVGAVNPNVLGITVGQTDLEVFARSKHLNDEVTVGRKRRRRRVDPLPSEQGWQDLSSHWHAPSATPTGEKGHHDHGTDPPGFPDDSDATTLLLGRITHFTSDLEFAGSPLKRHMHYSVGEMRLNNPGNTTGTTTGDGKSKGGWDEIVKYDFDLVVRGVLKYGAPVSGRAESAIVGGKTTVRPEDGDGGGGGGGEFHLLDPRIREE